MICPNMKDLAQLECYKPGCLLLTSRNSIIAICQLYRSSEIVTRLLRRLKIDIGLVNQDLQHIVQTLH